jgi:hypothetical protein
MKRGACHTVPRRPANLRRAAPKATRMTKAPRYAMPGARAKEGRRAQLAIAMMAVAWLTLHDVRAQDSGTPDPQCLHSYGKTACGYGCKASDRQVRCAQTPQGVCSAGSGILACWDPPPLVRSILGRSAPRPSCVTSSGQTACGYHYQLRPSAMCANAVWRVPRQRGQSRLLGPARRCAGVAQEFDPEGSLRDRLRKSELRLSLRRQPWRRALRRDARWYLPRRA